MSFLPFDYVQDKLWQEIEDSAEFFKILLDYFEIDLRGFGQAGYEFMKI